MKVQEFLQQYKLSERDLRELSRKLRLPIRRGTKKLKREWVRKIEEELKSQKDQAATTSQDVGKGKTVDIPYRVQVKRLAEILEIPVTSLITELINNGIMANLNEEVDFETASIIAQDLGFKTREKKIDETEERITAEKLQKILEGEDTKDLKPRPPVVTIMGHVDHGKTTLLDAIRETRVVSGEHGGITQHIGAYQVVIPEGKFKGKVATFLDTPGHEAFVSMRERGANSTDIAVLVVAADDGVKPQTIESIRHAKNANVPIIVAINKIDKAEANPQKVKQELADHDVLTEEWGGETPVVEISAKNKTNIDGLLEMILLVADLQELKANPDRLAIGTVIEGNLDKQRGPVATLLIQAGTLHVGDPITVGGSAGVVRQMEDDAANPIEEAGPSTPVRISGLQSVPSSGDIFQATDEVKAATAKAQREREKKKTQQKGRFGKVSMRRINESIQSTKTSKLNIVLKTDVQGSLEAILQVLETIKHDEVEIRVLSADVGNISESDVMRARNGEGLVVGFNVHMAPEVQKTAEEAGVQVLMYNVIYKLIEDLKGKLAELLKPKTVQESHGKMKIIAIFKQGRTEMIVGGKVMKGVIRNKTQARVLRDGKEIGIGRITQLQNKKEAVQEVKEGLEAGISFEGDTTIQMDDVIESFSEQQQQRSL